MIARTATIVNKLGLHARAAGKLVQVAQNYGARVEITSEHHKANGKSIMSVLMLQAGIGTQVEIIVEGDDEREAMDAILGLIEDKFGEGE
ncbi:MAG: HPr family phosphocarrier protein [Pseudomonadales bacterium]|nr:HPr family phosphocarrier protein [Pseudomonadales bacterium]